MTKLEQLKKAIQKANPDILKLELGCEVLFDLEDYNKKNAIGVFYSIDDKDEENIWANTLTYSDDLNPKLTTHEGIFIKKILGRPITLEDVLMTLAKRYGEWSVRFWGNGVIKIDENTYWQPSKDLDWHAKHKPETIDFLHKIICQI